MKEASVYLNCSLSHLTGLVYKTKKIPSVKVNNRVLLSTKELDDFIQREQNNNKSILYKKEKLDKLIPVWLDLYKKGNSFSQIAKEYELDPSVVAKRLKTTYVNFNFDIYTQRLSEEEVIKFERALEIYYRESSASILGLCSKFSISKSKLLRYMKNKGLKTKQRTIIASRCQKHDFFENIDSEIKAYLLGFFAADGHIEFKNDSANLKVGVSIKDSHIIHLFNKYISDNLSTVFIKTRNGRSSANISIGSRSLGESIAKLGFTNNKTYEWINLPSIAEEQMPHFIRGYFDGDGSIMVNPRREGNRLNGYNKMFNITCYNKSILEQVKDKLDINSYRIRMVGAHTKIVDGNEAVFKDNWIIEVWNTSDLEKIHNYLYNNARYYFKRKKDIFDLAILNSQEIDAALQGNL